MEDNKKAAIEKIYLLTKQDVEFNEELRKKLGIASSASSAIADDERLNQIYEYCIEDIICKQAEEFYKDFPIPELQDQLRADFRKMELFRRKNSFDDFCLSVYQQIENITNFLCEDESFNEVAQKMWAYPAYLRQGEGITPKLEERSSIYGKPYYAIAHLVFIGKDEQGHPNSIIRTAKPLREQFAWDKIRNVVYFIGYKAEMLNWMYNGYSDICNLLYELYQCRNLNHRGGNKTEKAEGVINKIKPLQSLYYFKFYGLLTQYVEFVKDGFPLSPRLISYANSLNTISIPIPKQEFKPIGSIPIDELAKRTKKK
jgi:hypothetical protein